MKNLPDTRHATQAASLEALVAEMVRARAKHPVAPFSALVSEVGELGEVYADGEGREREKAEALQVACVAMRIYEEGTGARLERVLSIALPPGKVTVDSLKRALDLAERGVLAEQGALFDGTLYDAAQHPASVTVRLVVEVERTAP